jgi:hypothetical protein
LGITSGVGGEEKGMDLPGNIKRRLWAFASSLVAAVLGIIAAVTNYLYDSTEEKSFVWIILVLGSSILVVFLSIVGFVVFKARSETEEESYREGQRWRE